VCRGHLLDHRHFHLLVCLSHTEASFAGAGWCCAAEPVGFTLQALILQCRPVDQIPSHLRPLMLRLVGTPAIGSITVRSRHPPLAQTHRLIGANKWPRVSCRAGLGK
jgi:hypothetical protein